MGRRTDPMTGGADYHPGLDIAGDKGQPGDERTRRHVLHIDTEQVGTGEADEHHGGRERQRHRRRGQHPRIRL